MIYLYPRGIELRRIKRFASRPFLKDLQKEAMVHKFPRRLYFLRYTVLVPIQVEGSLKKVEDGFVPRTDVSSGSNSSRVFQKKSTTPSPGGLPLITAA